MGSSYQRVALHDPDGVEEAQRAPALPNSPPPSFRSQDSSRRSSRDNGPSAGDNRDLHDAFDAPSDDESDNENIHDRRRLLSRRTTSQRSIDRTNSATLPSTTESSRRVTEIPVFTPTSGGINGARSQANDGVFANLTAKPRAGDEVDEKPPTYEQAAADATPPYWETTVLSPYHSTGNPDDVFVGGLLVGSVFSFIWNALISMSFQLIGFLLTYLLHTTHAAKNGSRAGLGVTLINYGFQMRYAASRGSGEMGGGPAEGVPDDPNAHNFKPSEVGNKGSTSITTADFLSYALMSMGWFILIRALFDYWKARRQEALVRSSPDRGLGVAVVATGEPAESSV